MSNPSFSNIDRWLFELMEGNLSPEQEAQLEAFLLQHPELDVDKDMWQLAHIETEELIFPQQEKLLKKRSLAPLFMTICGLFFLLFSADQTERFFPNPTGFSFHSLQTSALLVTGSTNSQHKGDKTQQDYHTVNNQSYQPVGVLINETAHNEKMVDESVAHMQFPSGGSVKNTVKPNRSSHGYDQTEVSQTNAQIPSDNEEILQDKQDQGSLTANDKSGENPVVIDNPTSGDVSDNKSAEGLDQNSKEDLTKTETPTEIQNQHKSTHSTKSIKLKSISLTDMVSSAAKGAKKMVDNPTGLRNLKETWSHVPGLLPLEVNNGTVGECISMRVQASSRAQWFGQDNEQWMNQLSIDGYAYGVRGGLGMQVKHNQYGIGGIQQIDVSLLYSPKISITKNILLEPSVRFKMGNKQINDQFIKAGSFIEYHRMNMVQYYEPGLEPYGRNLWYKDVALGMRLNTKWFYAGIQYDNMLQHDDNMFGYDFEEPTKAPRHMIVSLGGDYQTKKKDLAFSPYLIYQEFGNLREYWMGSNARVHFMTAGFGLSSRKELAAMIGCRFHRFTVSYTADYVKSQLTNTSGWSHQISVKIISKPNALGKRLIY
jgi:type IX secretion system PorP/SprF family membrane protein